MMERMREGAVVLAIVLGSFACGGVVWAQANGAAVETVGVTKTVRGRVLNQVTKEPIGRALVTMGDEYAVMTDDRGQFEMKITERVPKGRVPGMGGGTIADGGIVASNGLTARKPGFLPMHRVVMVAFSLGSTVEQHAELTIPLVPEALIVGHVNVPGSEGEVRINCGLYQRRISEGNETWQMAQNFMTWTNGEFRFSGLEAGTYRLITHEQMDRDSLVAMPGAPLFGYPPIYYPNTTDFSLAKPIVVKAGETAQVNLTVERRSYYRVRIPVGNATAAGQIEVAVHPMGHWGPGWSLGYNPMEQAIEGMLPDGNYTVELEALMQEGSTGMANFAVKGAPFEGAPVNLVPNTSVSVNIRTEFQHEQSGAEGGNAREAADMRPVNITVGLSPTEEFGPPGRGYQARSVEGTNNRTMMIDNVKPGRYRVTAGGDGYVASIESGGSDLMKQPVLVGIGGGVAPIEVTLRDDGAEVAGTMEGMNAGGTARETTQGSPTSIICLVPIGQGRWQQPMMMPVWNGMFKFMQVPPGEYLLLGYEEDQIDLPYGEEEFVKKMESKGQRIRVEAGEKVNVKVKLIAGGEGE
jgi:hypothetical protein